MAKKKENIVITDEELVPSVIGKLDTKEKSPALLIFIFIIFIAIAFFLPDITNYVNKIFKGEVKNPIVIKPNEKDKEKQDEESEITYYDYSTDLVITNELFSISNIVYTEKDISFNLKNLTNNMLDLNKLKYFLEIYSSDETLIERIKISYGILSLGEEKKYTYDLSSDTSEAIAKLLVVSKTENDYPEIVLKTDNEGNAKLECKKDINTITYSFVNDYLININDTINYVFDNAIDYNNNLQKYQLMAANNNNLEGVSATLITSETGFTYTALIDLRTANINELDNSNYYAYRTLAKTIKFETESNGYSCNE